MPPESSLIAASLPQSHLSGEASVQSLSTGGQMLIWSARRWLVANRLDEDASTVLTEPYRRLGIPGASAPLEDCMNLLALGANHHIAIRCLCSKTLSEDEHSLLRQFRALQAQDETRASEIAGGLIGQPLKRLFMERAKTYATALREAELNLETTPCLRLVRGERSAGP